MRAATTYFVRVLMLSLMALLSPRDASAAVITYHDHESFGAASGGQSAFDFQAPPPGAVTYEFEGAQFASVDLVTGQEFNVGPVEITQPGIGYWLFPHSAEGLFVPLAVTDVYSGGVVDPLEFHLVSGTEAFGLDFSLPGLPFPDPDLTVRYSLYSGKHLVASCGYRLDDVSSESDAGTQVFFGFVDSNAAITRLELEFQRHVLPSGGIIDGDGIADDIDRNGIPDNLGDGGLLGSVINRAMLRIESLTIGKAVPEPKAAWTGLLAAAAVFTWRVRSRLTRER